MSPHALSEAVGEDDALMAYRDTEGDPGSSRFCSLTSAVFEQSWQYDRVDEAVLEGWLEEIRCMELERRRRDASSEGKTVCSPSSTAQKTSMEGTLRVIRRRSDVPLPLDHLPSSSSASLSVSSSSASSSIAAQGARAPQHSRSYRDGEVQACGCLAHPSPSEEPTNCSRSLPALPSASSFMEGCGCQHAAEEPLESGVSMGSASQLPADIWQMVFVRLEIDHLPSVAAACREWRDIIRGRSLWAGAFVAAWKLRSVAGRPSSTAFWRGTVLTQMFALSHEVLRTDTVAGLAVKYNVQVMDIRRQNMMMSDHGIHSRRRVLIPITRKSFLEGQDVVIEMDADARREVAVLYVDAEGKKTQKSSPALSRARAKAMEAKVMASLKRSLRIDEGTASYYLTLAGGDLRAAYAAYLEDGKWERNKEAKGGRAVDVAH
eukprot:TRINITY_DN32364_c0_g1_i1.p1 TRINITY_DN32364_c0_g1~~TRINITY_DN32364_c0_g1_i1.p1  ORF type:complete len:433 (-),score=73.02 TRINITY_DN32364_c0_g1_i1:749-2047(-)